MFCSTDSSRLHLQDSDGDKSDGELVVDVSNEVNALYFDQTDQLLIEKLGKAS